MTSLKRYITVGGGGDDFVRWITKGQVLEGIWRGLTPGRYGDLGIVEDGEGRRWRFPLHTVLLDRVKRIREGAEIRIEYLGVQQGKRGQEFKAFEVGVGSADDLLEVPEEEVE